MQYNTILYEVKDDVATIILNRPDANNSVNLELARDLCYAAMECGENEKVRAILIRAAGKSFCAGGDVKSFAAQGAELPLYLKEVTTYLHLSISRFLRMDAPVIIAVNGVAAGAGMSLACGGDIVMAAESARFTMAYTRLGLTPDGGSTYFLPRIVGLKRALELALTNRMLSAKEALDLGIVTWVKPDAELQSSAESIARQLAAGATRVRVNT